LLNVYYIVLVVMSVCEHLLR